MRGRPKSLWRRSALLFALSGAIPIIVGGVVALWLTWSQLSGDIQERHLALARAVALQIREFFFAHEVALGHMAGLMMDASSPKMLADHMEALAAQGVALEACLLLDTRGRVRMVYPPRPDLLGLDYASTEEFIGATERGQAFYSRVHIPAGFEEPMVALALPLEGGVAMGFVGLSSLNNRVQQLASVARALVILTDTTGTTAFHPDPLFVARRENLAHIEPIAMGLRGKEGPVRYTHQGKRFLGAAAIVPDLGWPVAVVGEETRALALLRGLAASLLGALGGAALLSLLLGLYSTFRLLEPFSRLARGLRLVSEGRYSEPIESPPYEELRSVHAAFDRMVEKVQEREAALRESAKTWQRTFDAVPDPIWLLDADQRILKVNRAGSQLLGFEEGELLGRHCFELVHGTSSPPPDCPCALTMKSGQVHTAEQKALGRTLLVSTAPIVDASGGLVGFVHVTKDITEYRAMEEVVRTSEERYRSLVENSPDGIFMAELPSGRLLFANERICDMFGYSREEALELTFWDLFSVEERHKVEELLRSVMRAGSPSQEPLSLRAFCKDGSSLSIELRAAFVKYGGREVVQAVVRDVTEEERLQKQLQHAQRMEALGTLAAGVAHEFNNILAGIQGFGELLAMSYKEKGQEDTPEGQYAGEILASCDRAGALTRRMLTLARVEAGERCPLKVNQVVEGVERLLRQAIPPSIHIQLALTGRLPFVVAEPTQLEQVIVNLAVNARDAMPEGGTLLIGTRLCELDEEFCQRYPYVPPGRYVEIFVQDEGSGIPQEFLQRIFEPFFTTKEAGKGTGLGLSVSYSIIKAHGGYILAQSPPEGAGTGSVFRIFLPPVEVEEEVSKAGGASLPPPRGRGERVLVADDETRIRQILRKVLETSGYQVALVADGQQAFTAYVEALEKGRPFQAVILDVAMPVRDGKWAMARILEVDPGARVIIATGYTDQEFLDEKISQRARAILRKPFDMTKLLSTVRECLERSGAEAGAESGGLNPNGRG